MKCLLLLPAARKPAQNKRARPHLGMKWRTHTFKSCCNFFPVAVVISLEPPMSTLVGNQKHFQGKPTPYPHRGSCESASINPLDNSIALKCASYQRLFTLIR